MIKFYPPVITKVEAEKGKLSKDINISLKTKNLKVEKNVITLEYDFIISYGKDSKIVLSGLIIGNGNEEELKKFEEFWKENNKLKEDLFVILYNLLMSNLFNKIVEVADVVGLPAPVNLPLIKKEQLNKNTENNKNQ
ncbi:MAG: hypothetical protein ABGW69_01670 [Nanoarchaeota archaeon]